MTHTTRLILFTVLALASCARMYAQTTVQPAGVGKPFSNLQDSIALNYFFPQQGIVAGGAFFLGMVIRTTAAPLLVPGGKLANGQMVPIAGNQFLHGVIGNTYGSNSPTTFNVPNSAGRIRCGGPAAAPGAV